MSRVSLHGMLINWIAWPSQIRRGTVSCLLIYIKRNPFFKTCNSLKKKTFNHCVKVNVKITRNSTVFFINWHLYTHVNKIARQSFYLCLQFRSLFGANNTFFAGNILGLIPCFMFTHPDIYLCVKHAVLTFLIRNYGLSCLNEYNIG